MTLNILDRRGDYTIRGNLGVDSFYPVEGNGTLEGSTQIDTIVQYRTQPRLLNPTYPSLGT